MPDPHHATYQKGLMGELAAEEYLCCKGMICLDRRFRSPWGEIDLIMLDEQTIAFVEVKARSQGTLYAAQMAITPAKQRRIIQTALFYLNKHPEHANRMIRFDIICLADECVHHIPNAFEGSGW